MKHSQAVDDETIHVLSVLTLAPSRVAEVYEPLRELCDAEFAQLLLLADANHVVIRALRPVMELAAEHGDSALQVRCASCIAQEKSRITNAIDYLYRITTALEQAGCPTTVMKSLEHWPDLGNDLDLYTTASAEDVCRLMTEKFSAQIEPRSWGDRLANKWNFAIEGLPEAVEVHAQRLGQTGEHLAMAKRFVSRRVTRSVLGNEFRVPAPEERVIVATLQRMYRHFYVRVCDVANLAALVESGTIDFAELQRSASLGGIWKGVCALLRIVSDYVERYRTPPLALPAEVLAAAPFGAEKTYVRAKFIRVPIMPEGGRLYAGQVTQAAMRGDVAGTLRLSLLPYLASAAAISYRLTGSDKGIW
jgi:hypothetical protein